MRILEANLDWLEVDTPTTNFALAEDVEDAPVSNGYPTATAAIPTRSVPFIRALVLVL